MQYRINYTGKTIIKKKNINISINSDNGKRHFTAMIDLSEYNFPPESEVIIEVYHRMMESKRYYFGTVEKMKSPENTLLGSLGLGKNIRFRLFVVGRYGKIIGSADRINLQKRRKRTSLLPVEEAPLESTLWKLVLDGDEPLLQINERIEGIKTIAALDPRFIHSVYPAVVREILMYLAVVECINFGEPHEDWHIDWVNYSSRIYEKPPETSFADDKHDVLDWIDGAVRAFSESRKLDWRHPTLKEWSL
jgi:hypothetical protein